MTREIPLRGRIAAGRVALVDDEDYDLVTQYRWHAVEQRRERLNHAGPYASATVYVPGGHAKSLRMHVLITGVLGIDHADGNGLNNRRSNLRPATPSQQLANQRKSPGCTSRYKGVRWYPNYSKWHAGIRSNGRSKHLGYFTSEIDAALAYDAAARDLFGEFALPNFPLEAA